MQNDLAGRFYVLHEEKRPSESSTLARMTQYAYYKHKMIRIGGTMPKQRLNITVDAAVIERARRYTRRHNTSISGLVSEFLAHLPDGATSGGGDLSPTVKRLLGIAAGGPDREDYRRHLLEKYGT